MLFKLKGIMAFPAEHRNRSEITGSPGTLPAQRTFHLHPPEAADAVEVSVAASTAKGGILIADAAPGELLFLFLRPGGHGLGL